MGQGNSREKDYIVLQANNDREVFVSLIAYTRLAATFSTPVIYKYEFRFQRYRWQIEKRFHEVMYIDKVLQREFPDIVNGISRPPKYWLWAPDKNFFDRRAQRIGEYLQQLVDSKSLFSSKKLRLFLELSEVSFLPHMGRKSLKEGYLKKSSGGYTEKFSRKMGDYFTYWRWRYFVMSDNCISWYRNPNSLVPQGSIQVDRDFHFHAVGRIIILTTATRRIRLAASTLLEAQSWLQAMTQFYANTRRRYVQPYMSSAPVRDLCDLRVYTLPRDYMASVALAMLGAQQEIFITSWKNSPTVLLTRPPLPPLRLDQILRFKAEQGVKIYILLYKEVEFAGQGNDSMKAKTYLESLSPNIICLRHPNKLMGGSTAVMWSHHEKLVVVDRNMAFVGGIDLAFNRWDDETKSLSDEDGLKYPGRDYRQPAEGLFKPCRNPFVTKTGANGQIEVVMAEIGDSNLPSATADVVTLAAAYNDDAEAISPYGSANSAAVGGIEGESGQRMMSCDFGVMNLDRRTNLTLQTRNDSAYSSTRTVIAHGSSPANSGGTSQRGLGMPGAGLSGPSARMIGAPAQRLDSDGDDLDGSLHAGSQTMAMEHPSQRALRVGFHSNSKGGDDRRNSDGDAESHLSQIEENRERSIKFSKEELKEFAQEDPVGQPLDVMTVGPAAAIAAVMSEGTDVNVDSLTTTSIAAQDVIVVPDGPNSSTKSPNSGPKSSVKGALSMFVNAATDFVAVMKDAIKENRTPQRVILRETHPRMPWHDLHSAVSGAPARDVASHFIQRWNHHRLATGNYDVEALVDTTDDCNFGICARCSADKIFETAQVCPTCGLFLGEISRYLQDIRPELCPETPQSFSYITYECRFPGFMCCRYLGDCPVVVTQLVPPAREEDFFCEGLLVEQCGDDTSELLTLGLVPAVGDIIVEVSGQCVTQLDHLHLMRYIKRQQDLLAESNEPLTVRFRRHYVADNFIGLRDEEKQLRDKMAQDALAVHNADEGHNERPSASDAASFGASLSNSAFRSGNSGVAFVSAAVPIEENGESRIKSESLGLPPPAVETRASMTSAKRNSLQGAVEEAYSAGTSVVLNMKDEVTARVNDAREAGSAAVSAAHSEVIKAAAVASQTLANIKGKEPSLDMVCQLTATREIALSIAKLYHVPNSVCNLPNRTSNSGSCRVQMLRSVGPWSCGQRVEKSIMTAWTESIMTAEKFIYIENQFFIGSLVGPEVQNSIPGAILERVVRAARSGEKFRAIIIIPEHPNGDHVNGSKARIILHYELQTINRGARSLLQQFKQLCPGVNPSDYIEFFCLRNWGTINNLVVSDQIYVHDKLLIVDDRFVICGSANINDRSMLGDRDSEVAIRFEDSTHFDITMQGLPFEVGFAPHTLRTQLMRQHLGDPTADIIDVLDPVCYNNWRRVAQENTSHFDALMGNTSIYRCRTLVQYSVAWAKYQNGSIFDAEINNHCMSIQGHICMWPLDFLCDENLAPSLATRALIPTDLWV